VPAKLEAAAYVSGVGSTPMVLRVPVRGSNRYTSRLAVSPLVPPAITSSPPTLATAAQRKGLGSVPVTRAGSPA
jgi:hypothetical protein